MWERFGHCNVVILKKLMITLKFPPINVFGSLFLRYWWCSFKKNINVILTMPTTPTKTTLLCWWWRYRQCWLYINVILTIFRFTSTLLTLRWKFSNIVNIMRAINWSNKISNIVNVIKIKISIDKMVNIVNITLAKKSA